MSDLYSRGAHTLVASWEAYAGGSDGAAVLRSPGSAAAVFPHEPARSVYNNALIARGLGSTERAAALDAVEIAYASAGVARFAVWVHESDEALRADVAARGYALDVVLYKKYEGSTYVDLHEKEKVTFKDLPDRFPSVLSLDFRKEQGHYEDFDNLLAMYLLYNMGRHSVRVNDETKLLYVEKSKDPMPYPEAFRLAAQSAKSDSDNFRSRTMFRPRGTPIGAPDNKHLYNFTDSPAKSRTR